MHFYRNWSEYIEEEAAKRTIAVSYSITTNGTIMNNEVLEWLVNNRVHLKLSIDGTMETHEQKSQNKTWYRKL